MDLLFAVTSILFAFSVINNLLFSADLLHRSNYKFRLLFPTIRKIGLNTEQIIVFFIKIVGLTFFIPFAVYDLKAVYYHLVILSIFLIEFRFTILNLKRISYYKSIFYEREFLISLLTIFLIIFLFFIPLTDNYFWLLLVERLSFIFYFFSAFVVSFPFEIYEDLQIEKIKKKHHNLPFAFTIVIFDQYSNNISDILAFILGKNNIYEIRSYNFDNMMGILRKLTRIQNIENNINLFNLSIAPEDIEKSLEIIHPQIINISGLYYKKLTGPENLIRSALINNKHTNSSIIINAYYENSKTRLIKSILKLSKTYKQVFFITSIRTFNGIILPENVKIIYCSEMQNENELNSFFIKIDKKTHYFSSTAFTDKYVDIYLPAIVTAFCLNYSFKDLSRILAKSENYLSNKQ